MTTTTRDKSTDSEDGAAFSESGRTDLANMISESAVRPLSRVYCRRSAIMFAAYNTASSQRTSKLVW
jgi:hypothetical protein